MSGGFSTWGPVSTTRTRRRVSCTARTRPVRSRPGLRILRSGRVFAAVLIGLLTLIGNSPSQAQSRLRNTIDLTRSAISGSVIDAESGNPLPLAQVLIEKIEGIDESDTFDRVRGESDPQDARGFRAVLTDPLGRYTFNELDPAHYRIHVQSAGYAPASVDVDLTRGGEVRISVGLEFQPVELPTVAVTGEAISTYLRTRSAEARIVGARRNVVAERQADFVSSDVRVITAGDVDEAITLAEPDLFRALQRIPGVARRDDYTAVLWTRGAPWPQTRVYFDGMPLYNPTHGGWLFSAINPDGVGEVVFHPGVRSAEIAEGAAGVLDLRSRSGGAGGFLNVRGEMSLASAKIAADGRVPGGASWMLAGRRTYVDVASRAWGAMRGDTDLYYIPYDFSDLIGRVDIPLPGGIFVEASGILEKDRLRGDIDRLLERNRAHWGNRTGRFTIGFDLGPATFSATTGATRFVTRVDTVDLRGWDDPDIPTLSGLTNEIDHDRRTFRLANDDAASRLQWSVGYEQVTERLAYLGPFSLTGEGIPGLPLIEFNVNIRNRYEAAWAETRIRELVERLELQAGVRTEYGDSVRNGGKRRVAPRLAARWQASPTLTLSAGWGRTFQYTQAIGASGGPLGPQLHIGNLWILSNVGYSALRADITTVGIERWMGRDWLLTANAYHRDVTGSAEPDPTPGPIRQNASHVEADVRASGLEFSLRRLAGSWTGSLGYGYGISTTITEELRYPSSADVRHTFDVTAAYQVTNRLRLGGALSLASGVPYTRVLIADRPTQSEPFAFRTATYAGFDLVLDYATTFNGWNVDMYLQLLNVFNRSNRITYAGSRCLDETVTNGPTDPCPETEIRDEFKSGLPRLPLFGIRIAL